MTFFFSFPNIHHSLAELLQQRCPDGNIVVNLQKYRPVREQDTFPLFIK
jgi:hypothetical protein